MELTGLVNKIKTKLKWYYDLLIKKIKTPLGKLVVAMIMILVVIAILLIQGVVSDSKKDVSANDREDVFVECTDERLDSFIKKYFKARSYLDFINIYRAFDKDYLALKDTDEGKRYDNGILYEKNYVKGYSNIKTYEHDGISSDEKVVLITYDMSFYFSDVYVPSMIVGYVKNDGNKIYFKENLDIGESKYISNLMESTMVKTMYEDMKNRLEILLTNDNTLKLAYNSLRQYDINPNNYILDDKDMLIEKVFGTDDANEKELINLALEKEEADEEE